VPKKKDIKFSQIIATDLKTYKSLHVASDMLFSSHVQRELFSVNFLLLAFADAVFAFIFNTNPKVLPKVHEHSKFNRKGLDGYFSSENQC
jgi:hypothetical protein